jgi:hypothetical protein
VLTVLLAVWALAAEPPALDDAALKAEVRSLVKQLDANTASERKEAESKLIKLGPAVLDLLPLRSANAEVEGRLARIRQTLQDAVAENSVTASVVTLRARKTPLPKILATFQQQTGNRIVDGRKQSGPAADPELDVSFQKTPFWQALDAVLDQAGFTVYPYGQDAVQIVPRPEGQLPRSGRAAYSGPFRVDPARIAARRDLRSTAGSALQLSLEVSWEPRAHPIGLKQRMATVQAATDAGPLPVDDPQAESEALLRRGAIAVDMGIPFASPSRQAREITSLKGSIEAIIPGRIETFRFADLLKSQGQRKRVAGAAVTLEQVRKGEEKKWELLLRVQYDDAGQALESHRTWIMHNEAYLEGPDGKNIAFESSEITRRGKNEFGMAYVFPLDKPPEGLTFVYKTPGAIFTKSYSYELKGIPLP